PPSPPEVEKALEPLTADGSLQVSAREVPPEPDPGATGVPYVLTVHGGDRPGIVSAVTGELAGAGGNITDLTTRLTGSLYLLVAEVDLPAGVDVDALTARLVATGESLGVGVTLREQETDVL
ncbi:MAG TPA: ACT domain-containing protein, partial [Jiangellaceae bacterium]